MATPPRGFGSGSGGLDRNTITFMIIMVVFLFGYDFFIAGPQRQAAQHAQQYQAQHPVAAAKPPLDRSAAIGATARAGIDNKLLEGSIALIGARFDDLSLKGYKQTVEKNSADVALLNPYAAVGGYDSYLGWGDPYTNEDVAGPRTQWTAPTGAKLTPQTPLALSYATPDGLAFTRTIAIDDRYMFTITDTVVNNGPARRALRPFSVVRRRDKPSDFLPNGIVHQGLVGVIGEKNFQDQPYQNADKFAKEKLNGKQSADAPLVQASASDVWVGLSDHYWLGALIPPANEQVQVRFDANRVDNYTDYRVSYWGAARAIEPGQSISYTQRFFAGAKRVDILQTYQKTLAIPDFDKAVDWGNFWFLTRPFFTWLLDPLGKLTGNFGIAILLTTIAVKALLFPLVNTSFESMSKLRKVQPKMKEIQDRFAADKERQQQEMMKLYQTEKINPLAGCLPILAQIPIFFALYKTLSVTIEMRHAPFFGWINDLSARDPTNLFNLFGLLPFDPAHLPMVGGFLWLGALPILYGLSMFATQSLSPPAPDPTQQMVFRYMPLLMTFMFSSFAAGLVIYWTWSNILSFAQQYVIMRKNGVETEIDKLIKKYITKSAPAET